jgi:hypothetical protein
MLETSSCMSAPWKQHQYNLRSRLACHSMPAGLLTINVMITPSTVGPRNLAAVMAEWKCDLSDAGHVQDFIVFGEYDHDGLVPI